MGEAKSNNFRHKNFAIGVIILIAIAYVGFDLWSTYSRDQSRLIESAEKQQASDLIIQSLVTSEELLLELTPQLRPLSTSVSNMQLPDGIAVATFSPQVIVSGGLERANGEAALNAEISRSRWEIKQQSALVDRDALKVWPSLFEGVSHFEYAKFFFVKGEFESQTPEEFRSTVGFDGLATLNNGSLESIQAEIEVVWERATSESTNAGWLISSWELTSFKSMASPKKLFRNVLRDAIGDHDLYTKVTNSRHTELTSHLMAGKEYTFPPGEKYPFFFPDVTLEHPGVSIVDIDDDGFEDFYVAMQHNSNLLFRNRGDGTFEEVAAKYGLAIQGDSTSAIFADFDNDGDPDLFLGRARRKSLYFVNEGGMFVDKTVQLIGCELPALVSSISAADYDNDGLLDIYFSTYSPIEESNRFQVANKPMWIELFLTPAQGAEVSRRNRSSHRFMDRAGPPNLLLRNVGGGKFSPAKENAQLQLWRMTFQASWNDFDRDGDQDVYVSNDYAPDNFFRNDGPDGFKDITKEVGLTAMGFGMGVSWGDYDNDGQIDVFVTNMFSKAGQRITDRIADIDPRIREMAQGNFLYRLNEGKFSLVSANAGSKLKVAKSGWSWGGQFFDFDNDGFQDIYATSGYYTAPADVAIDVDL